ncbi:MAG: hypothetical protein ABL903_08885 [Methylococcales bacterium]
MNTKPISFKQRRPLIAVTFAVALIGISYSLFPSFRESVGAVFNRNSATLLSAKAINSAKPIANLSPQTDTENQNNFRAGEGSQSPVAFDSPRLISLEKQLSALTKLLENQQQQNETHRQALDAQFNALQENLTALKNQLPKPFVSKATAKVAKQAENKKSDKTSKTQTAALKQKIIRPPFQLVSLDSWGDITYPVVRYQGKLHSLKAGHTLANWRFDSVDPSGEGVFVLDSTGKKALLTLDNSPG